MENPVGREELTDEEQKAALSKVTWRLVPLLFFCYIIAYIDRINVGFAKSHLQPVLDVDPAIFGQVFGTGAGLFFIGYFIFEVPSNLALQKVGARIWIARIMIVWGLVSMGFMFLKGAKMFYIMRFLLGAAEAGFFPGVILYLTYWFPAKERARTVAFFALGGVAAGVVGSPISGALLKMHGIGGMEGWRWLFLLEAIPAIVMGLVLLFILPNGPADARFLEAREKNWLIAKIAAEARSSTTKERRLRDAFTSPRVWVLCLLYFLVNVAGYGYEFWLPSIVKGISGGNDFMVGLINMIPYLAAGTAMVLVGRSSDRTGERRGHIAISAGIAACGFTCAALAQNPWLAMLGLIVALMGQKSTLGPFWALGTSYLSGTAAAGGIALINSVGNLGGYFGPTLVGRIKDSTGSETAALLWLGGALLIMAVVALTLPANRPKEPATPLSSEEG
jgi:ACS family tartrate transporter-like MFS transporter